MLRPLPWAHFSTRYLLTDRTETDIGTNAVWPALFAFSVSKSRFFISLNRRYPPTSQPLGLFPLWLQQLSRCGINPPDFACIVNLPGTLANWTGERLLQRLWQEACDTKRLLQWIWRTVIISFRVADTSMSKWKCCRSARDESTRSDAPVQSVTVTFSEYWFPLSVSQWLRQTERWRIQMAKLLSRRPLYRLIWLLIYKNRI